jgi:cytochrome c oxidase cbb3-type subunit 4
MDAGTLGAISTVLVMVAFFGVCWWAFSPKRKQRFEDDANLPFADEDEHKQTANHNGDAADRRK